MYCDLVNKKNDHLSTKNGKNSKIMILPYLDLTTTFYKEDAKTHFLLYSQLVEANKSVPKANISYLEYEFFH